METDADASGIQTWLFGSVRVTPLTNQTHRFPMSLSRMGSHPMRRHGNRIGGHKNRSFLYGTVRPRVNSECGIIYNPRPLALKACLKRLALTQQVSMPWNRHHGTESHQNQKKIRNSVSTSPGTDQFTRLGSSLVLCTAGFA